MVVILFFILGISVGSFLNIVILRVFLNEHKKLDKNIYTTHSVCDSCNHVLAWYDLIPLLSYIYLGGKCRYCHKKIIVQHTVVEILTGFIFAGYGYFIFWDQLYQFSLFAFLLTLYSLIVISVLLIIAVVDFYKYIIPNSLMFPLIIAGVILEPLWAVLGLKHTPFPLQTIIRDVYWGVKLVFEALSSSSFPHILITFWSPLPSYVTPLLAGCLAGMFFYLLVIVTKGKGMGMGDVKLAIFMGLFLGIDKVVMAIYLAFIIGAVVSLLLIFKKQKTLKQIVPFGPFLITGFLVSWFLSEIIIEGYATIISGWSLF